MAAQPTVVNNKRLYRFELTFENGDIAFLEYRWLKANMVLMRTLVPKDQRGHGYGALLAQAALQHARTHGLKVIVYCPFIIEYMKTHPQNNDLLATP